MFLQFHSQYSSWHLQTNLLFPRRLAGPASPPRCSMPIAHPTPSLRRPLFHLQWPRLSSLTRATLAAPLQQWRAFAKRNTEDKLRSNWPWRYVNISMAWRYKRPRLLVDSSMSEGWRGKGKNLGHGLGLDKCDGSRRMGMKPCTMPS